MKTPVVPSPTPPLGLSDAQLHEVELIRAFVVPSKRNLDSRFIQSIPPAKQTGKAIEQLLCIKGSPVTCYAISMDPSIDGRFLPLKEALATVVGYGIGTFLSCLPGKLGYFEGESAGQRFILERPFRDRRP